jgi:hypothetical protein
VSTSPGAKAQAEPCHRNLLTIIGISELAEASLDDIPFVLEYRPDFVTIYYSPSHCSVRKYHRIL